MTNTWVLTTDRRIVNLAEAAAAIGGITTVIAVVLLAPIVGGVDIIVHAPITENILAEVYAGAVVGLLADAKGGVILVVNRPAECSLAGAAATAFALPVVVGATSVSAEGTEVTRYGGLTGETVVFKGAVLILEDGAASEAGGPVTQAHEGAPMGVVVVNAQPVGSGPANFAAARRIASYGCGFETEEDLDLARILVEALGAEIACSHPLIEDTAWLSKDRYVGVSGMYVAPDVYVALGISGQVQHTSGMADSKIAVVINNDVNTPIFRISDYSIVGDIYDVVPAFIAALSRNKKKNMSEEVGFGVIVIGGGVVGVVCTYTLAEQGWEILLIERAVESGSKNLPGGVFYCRVMEKVFPSFVDVVPVECRITRNYMSLTNASSFVNIDYWNQRLSEPVGAVTVLRAKLDVRLLE